MEFFEAKFQLGKGGMSQGFIDALITSFKSHRQARISVLKSALADSRNKESINKMAEEIASKMPFKCGHKVIGFTIILIKLGKKREEENE